MPFINEVVSDEDIDRYGLPFAKGSGRFWTRDADRDYYLWGGKEGNPAFGEPFQGCFRVYLAGELFILYLEPGAGSSSFSDDPFLVIWKSLLVTSPTCPPGPKKDEIIRVLKEALLVYGEDGRGSRFTKGVEVRFMF